MSEVTSQLSQISKVEVRSLRSDIKINVESLKLEVRGWKSEVKSWKVGRWKLEVKSQKLGVRSLKHEAGSQNQSLDIKHWKSEMGS